MSRQGTSNPEPKQVIKKKQKKKTLAKKRKKISHIPAGRKHPEWEKRTKGDPGTETQKKTRRPRRPED